MHLTIGNFMTNEMQYEGRIKVHDGNREIDCDLYIIDNGGYFADSGTTDGPSGRVMRNPRTGLIEFMEPAGVRTHSMQNKRKHQYTR